MNRRAFIAGSLVLAGCGDTSRLNSETKALARRSVAIDYASYYAPIADVQRLVQARAAAVGAQLTLSDDPAGATAQVANLERWTGSRGGFRAVAVAPFDAAAVDAVAAKAIARGVKIVSYITPLAHQSAAISVDRGHAGGLLAGRAHDRVLLVAPPAHPAVPDPFAPGFAAAEAAIRKVCDVAAVVQASAVDDARSAVAAALAPGIRSVLCWNDQTALGAAAAAPHLFVGGLGAPSLTSPAALHALRAGHIDALATARLATLANALVDLPLALARGRDAGSVTVPVTLLEPRSELRPYAQDFAA